MPDKAHLSNPMRLAFELAIHFMPDERFEELLNRATELDEKPFIKGKAEAVAHFLRIVQDGLVFGRWP